MPLMKSNPATLICKACLKDYEARGFRGLVSPSQTLCPKCREELTPSLAPFKDDEVRGYFLFSEGSQISSLLKQYISYFDIELSSIFLSYPLPFLKIRFKNYLVVTGPYVKNKNEVRGYDPDREIAKYLDLEIISPFEYIDESMNFAKSVDILKAKNRKILYMDIAYSDGVVTKEVYKILRSYTKEKIVSLFIVKNFIESSQN